MKTAILLGFLSRAAGDCYLQLPAGSNNRLDEGGGNRNNNNRLMDTQNNAKGGYGYGGDANNKADPLAYMAGSLLSMSWTSQHSCGSENAECQVVIQYMCNSVDGATPAGLPATMSANGAGEGPLRDGTDNGTPDPNNPNAATGLHESAAYYNACNDRERNKGLYTADQNLNNGQGAAATRQNPNGARSGQECPEERDYYPYWHPTPWKDLAVMTNNLALCAMYQAESQNVKAKNYCTDNAENNEADCTGAGGQWLAQAPFNIAAPECVVAPFQRDNHLGNGPTGHEIGYNLTIPSAVGANGADDETNCAMRFRYNITTHDTRTCSDKTLVTEAACVAANAVWSAATLDANYDNLVDGNNNQGNGNNNPPLLEQNPDMDMNGELKDTGGSESLLELAINTNQFGRTFQDRTHVFSIRSRPAAVGALTSIFNLNVRGKRGNIVQTYPATEYDFSPVDVIVGANDLLHVQWTGNDNTNNNGNNNGEGTNNEDRHNIVQLDNSGDSRAQTLGQQNMFDVAWEWNPLGAGTSEFGGSRDEKDLTKQFALVRQTGCLTEGQINNDQQRQNCQKLNAAAATVDLGLVQFKPGMFKYMSSRNNNFSNRAQKASIQVLADPTLTPGAPVAVAARAVPTEDNSKAAVMLTWSRPGATAPYVGTDGKEYWGMDQQTVDVVDYSVQYSIDGGSGGTWIPAPGCAGNINSCEIVDLPAGTPTIFRVLAGSAGGWGEPSELVSLRTIDSDASSSCQKMLLDQADGSWVAPGIIVVGVMAAIAFLLILAALYFVMKRRQPPPPPPGGEMKGVPPAY